MNKRGLPQINISNVEILNRLLSKRNLLIDRMDKETEPTKSQGHLYYILTVDDHIESIVTKIENELSHTRDEISKYIGVTINAG